MSVWVLIVVECLLLVGGAVLAEISLQRRIKD